MPIELRWVLEYPLLIGMAGFGFSQCWDRLEVGVFVIEHSCTWPCMVMGPLGGAGGLDCSVQK